MRSMHLKDIRFDDVGEQRGHTSCTGDSDGFEGAYTCRTLYNTGVPQSIS